jgi:putative hydrolase of the HAD superfamily
VIRAVISDFGGVLTTPLMEAFVAYQERSGIGLEELGAAMARAAEAGGGSHPLFELEKGEISEAEFLARIERELGDGVHLHGFRETYFDNLRANDPMIDYMRGLRGRGLRMALLTNNVREWEPHWRAKLPDVDAIFEVIVDSAFVGMRKPDREIYELTLERLGGGLEPSECVFVDDVEANCDTASAMGMVAVRFVDNDQALAELDAALGRG